MIEWILFGAYAVLTVAAYLLTPKASSPAPPGAGKVELPTTEAGTTIPVVFGTREITKPNLVYWGNVSTDPIRKRGGKK